MEEKTGIFTADEIAQQLFRLTGTPLEIHGAQDRNDILKQELGIVCSAVL